MPDCPFKNEERRVYRNGATLMALIYESNEPTLNDIMPANAGKIRQQPLHLTDFTFLCGQSLSLRDQFVSDSFAFRQRKTNTHTIFISVYDVDLFIKQRTM